MCSRMKEQHRILTTLDGVHENVIVIKPPMCFSKKSADIFVTRATVHIREQCISSGSSRAIV